MNWRIAAVAMIGLALLLCMTLAITVGRSGITPYVVEVDRLGEVRAVGPAIEILWRDSTAWPAGAGRHRPRPGRG
jgi:type IV secretory pathway TrbF-like protein